MKRLTAILLVMTMIVTLAGCGDARQEEDVNSETNVAETNEGTLEQVAEIKDITVKLINTNGNVTDGDRITEEINKISTELIGVRADIEWINIGEWNQKISLMLSAGDEIDLMSISPTLNMSALVQQKQLMDISDAAVENAPETLELMEKFLPAGKVGDALYVMPKLYDPRGNYFIVMNKEMLEAIDRVDYARNMTTWEEYEVILTEIHEKFPDVVPSFTSYTANSGLAIAGYDMASNAFAENKVIDSLGDHYNLVYVDPMTDTVHSYFTSDIYKGMIERAADWYKKGLLYSDGMVSQEELNSMLKSGEAFSGLNGGEGDNESKYLGQIGKEVVVTNICPSPARAILITMFGYGVPYSAQEPEAAVAFMNLLYTNEAVNNLLAWGQEGTDYVVGEDGIATFPEGQDLQSVGYHYQSYLVGNGLLPVVWEGNPADYNEVCMEAFEQLEVPKYMGFVADTSEITNEITACYNATEEYRPGLETGMDSEYQTSLSTVAEKLNAGGIDKIVATYQAQLDAWLASQGE